MAKSEATERPILFSAPMVKALLAGTKTQTRRIVTVRNSHRQASPNSWPFDLSKAWRDTSFAETYGEYLHVPFRHPDEDWSQETSERWTCRWMPGERLWVRETFWTYPGIITDGLIRDGADTWPMVEHGGCAYDADGDQDIWRHLNWVRKPSIFMPRWASRITLEITDVRVQRLQEISREDAIAEGVQKHTDEHGVNDYTVGGNAFFSGNPIDCYRNLWNSINGPGSWDANPWVWTITFRRTATAN